MKKLILILGIIFIGLFFVRGKRDESFVQKELNQKNLYFAIRQLGIKHADIVFAQIILESDNLSSKLVEKNNNLLGMRLPKKRNTTASNSKGGYAVYDNWYASVVDYHLFQKFFYDNFHKKYPNKELTDAQYLNKISKNYAEASDYSIRVKRVLKENFQLIKEMKSEFTQSNIDTNVSIIYINKRDNRVLAAK